MRNTLPYRTALVFPGPGSESAFRRPWCERRHTAVESYFVRFAPPCSFTAAELNSQKVLKVIYFDFDKYDLRADARATLAQNAQWLKANPSWRIQIEGHCDERGTNEYNMALGDRRANSARAYLISAGVPASRVRTISYGEERPAVQGNTDSAWARNRRGNFVVEE